ncbi:hypothetical protein MBLNU459_g2127t1 [Dothideomycetes sp. NU459]
MAKQLFAPLRAAAIDGRTRTVFYRQTQLEKLHQQLVENSSAIQEAIVNDSGITKAEARTEYALALADVKERYAELDPKKELAAEYSIANGKDAADLRIGAGVVYIQANSVHSVFYSVISPLSAAIAAGNCIVLQVENSLRSLPAILRKVLKGALDPDTFGISQQPITNEEFLGECIQVIQDGKTGEITAQNQLVSNSGSITAAVVDRTANLDEAAKELINARFAFGGKSPYAPDIVFVNEFVKKDFLQALVRQSISVGETVRESGQKSKESGLKDLIGNLQKNGDVRIIAQESSRAILDVKQRSAQLFDKVREPCLIVHAIRSLDDAIDLINNNSKELLAAYHWGKAGECKYLSQFIAAQVSFVNHVPTEILVGPAFPANHPVVISTRYPTALFTKPVPAFTMPSSKSKAVESALLAASASDRATALRKLYAEATSALAKDKKQEKQIRAHFGFFEQAMLFNLGWVLLTTAGTIGGGVYWLRHARSFR